MVKKHSNGDHGEKSNTQSSNSPKRGQLENLATSTNADDIVNKKNKSKSGKLATKPKKSVENVDDKQLKNKNINNNKQLKHNNNINNKPKTLISGGGALLKKLFSRKSGKYEKSSHTKNNSDNNNRFGNIGDDEDDNVAAPIVVKEVPESKTRVS